MRAQFVSSGRGRRRVGAVNSGGLGALAPYIAEVTVGSGHACLHEVGAPALHGGIASRDNGPTLLQSIGKTSRACTFALQRLYIADPLHSPEHELDQKMYRSTETTCTA
jgi:hypothetical protein